MLSEGLETAWGAQSRGLVLHVNLDDSGHDFVQMVITASLYHRQLLLVHLVGLNASWALVSCTGTLSFSAWNRTEKPRSTVASAIKGVLFERGWYHLSS